ncbi:hypothetical protein MBLNU230_g2877t1 [Neophaeotheca triangularis]
MIAPLTPGSDNEEISQTPELTAIVLTPEISPLRLSMPLEIPESREDTTVMDSEDDSEYEYTDDEEPDDNDTLEFIVEGPALIKKMVTYIARSYEEDYRKVAVEYNAATFV